MDCNTRKTPLGVTRCNKLPAMPKSMIVTPIGFKFTAAQVASATLMEAALQAAILAGEATRVHCWPNFVSFENISEDAVYEETPLAYLAVRDGNYRFRFSLKESLCLHKSMFTHRANSGRAFLFDVENQLIGTLDSDGNFYGFTIQLLHTEKMVISDGSVSTKSPIVLALADNKELDAEGALVDAPYVNTVDKLTDVELTIVSATSSEIVVDAKITCDGSALNGLVLADFVLLDDAGAAQSIATATEVDGRYTLTATTTFADGTLNLDDPDQLSIQAYEAQAVEVTIAT